MKIDKYHLNNVSKEDLLKELVMIDEEMADRMFPVSYAAAQRSRAWKVEIERELYLRTNRRW